MDQVSQAADVTNKQDQAAQNELNKTSIDLTTEKNATDSREHKSNIVDLQTQIGPNSNLFSGEMMQTLELLETRLMVK